MVRSKHRALSIISDMPPDSARNVLGADDYAAVTLWRNNMEKAMLQLGAYITEKFPATAMPNWMALLAGRASINIKGVTPKFWDTLVWPAIQEIAEQHHYKLSYCWSTYPDEDSLTVYINEIDTVSINPNDIYNSD